VTPPKWERHRPSVTTHGRAASVPEDQGSQLVLITAFQRPASVCRVLGDAAPLTALPKSASNPSLEAPLPSHSSSVQYPHTHCLPSVARDARWHVPVEWAGTPRRRHLECHARTNAGMCGLPRT
jgi:hypothetical protein